jgi:GNAT superfamily N-acetyltransferase
MRFEDVTPAAAIIQSGSLAPESEHPEAVEAYWAAVEETRRRNGDVLVAELGREVVGVIQVMVMPHFQHTGGWVCEVESVYVREGMRGQTIGAQMLAAAEEMGRRAGCYRVQLTSNMVREDAHRFYESHGYAATKRGFWKVL